MSSESGVDVAAVQEYHDGDLEKALEESEVVDGVQAAEDGNAVEELLLAEAALAEDPELAEALVEAAEADGELQAELQELPEEQLELEEEVLAELGVEEGQEAVVVDDDEDEDNEGVQDHLMDAVEGTLRLKRLLSQDDEAPEEALNGKKRRTKKDSATPAADEARIQQLLTRWGLLQDKVTRHVLETLTPDELKLLDDSYIPDKFNQMRGPGELIICQIAAIKERVGPGGGSADSVLSFRHRWKMNVDEEAMLRRMTHKELRYVMQEFNGDTSLEDFLPQASASVADESITEGTLPDEPGSSSGWWGLACPAHCSGSFGLWAAIFVAGFSVGALCTLLCLRDLLIREDLLRRALERPASSDGWVVVDDTPSTPPGELDFVDATPKLEIRSRLYVVLRAMTTMAQLLFASEGYVQPFLARPPVGGSPGEPDRQVLCIPVVPRKGGFLLALPVGAVPPNLLAQGNEADAQAMFGPSTTLSVPAMVEEEDGGEVPAGSALEVLVVDLAESACEFLEPYDPLLLIDPVPFSSEAPGSFPEGAQLVSLCKAWARTVAAERTAFYSALEAEVEQGDLDPEAAAQARAAPQRQKQKRVTTNQLAEQIGSISELLPALSNQLQALSEKQQALEQKVAMGVPSAAPQPAHRQPFALPAAGAPTSKAGAMAQLAGVLGPPPKARAEPAIPEPAVQEPPSLEGVGEILEAGPSPMAAALAQQTEALTQLVGHLIQAELSMQTGNFMLAVAQNGHRRMFPTEAVPKSLEELRREPRRFTFSQYLERHGGYQHQKDLGLIMYMVCQVSDMLLAGSEEGALDLLSLLMVCLEQAALDHGKFEVAYTLSLFAEPPSQVFSNRGTPQNPRLRAFAPLCPLTWATTALAFLKETDSILARRNEASGGASSSGHVARDEPDPAPKKAPAKSLFPLPLPYFGIFRALPPHLGSAARSRIGVKRAVFVTVAALNYLYAGLRPVAHAPLRRPPSDLQAKALDYLERLVKACGAVEAVDPVSASRRSSKLAACLEQVCQGLTSLGPSFDRYGPAFPGLPLDQQTAFDALHPYRGLDPARLKLAGRANWDPSEFLDDLFYLPFREPQVLLLPEVGPPAAFEVPDISREVPSRVLALAKLWDSFGLLRLSKDGPETQDQAVRVFNAAKNKATDRSLRNVLCPALRSEDLSGLAAFDCSPCLADSPSGISSEPAWPNKVFACFGAILQGDALGVEFACSCHSNLLSAYGLLGADTRLQGGSPFPSGAEQDLIEGLVIDDWFAVACQPIGEQGPSASGVAFARAQKAYGETGLFGSPEKDIYEAACATIAGAEVDSSEPTRQLGLALVGPAKEKRIALAALSLEAARLPRTSDSLHLSLTGAWVSACLFRRPFMSVLDRVFHLVDTAGVKPESPKAYPLPRRTANEFVVLSALSLVLTCDVSAPWSGTLFATDSSSGRGAIVEAEVGPEATALLWRSDPRAASSGRLLSKDEAVLHGIDPDREPVVGEVSGEKVRRPPACRFHFLELWGSAGSLSVLVAAFGWTTGPCIDPSVSCEYDPSADRVFEWISFLVERGRVDAVGISLPLVKKANRYALKALALLKVCKLHGIPGVLVHPVASFASALPSWLALCRRPDTGSERLCLDWAEAPLHLLTVCLPSLAEASSTWRLEALAPPGRDSARELALQQAAALLDLGLARRSASLATCYLDAAGLESTFVNDLALSAPLEGYEGLVLAVLRRVAASCIAYGLYPVVPFCPTRLMPADAPSRGADLEPPSHSVFGHLEQGREQSAVAGLPTLRRWAANWLRLFFGLCHFSPPAGLLYRRRGSSYRTFVPSPLQFDGTLGFPGEGPSGLGCLLPPSFHAGGLLRLFLCCAWAGSLVFRVGAVAPVVQSHGLLRPRNPGDLLRKSRRGPEGLPVGRVVEPATQRNRDALWSAFLVWLDGAGVDRALFTSVEGVVDIDSINCIFGRYGRDLYAAGRPFAHYSETLNAFAARVPKARRLLQPAWDLAFSWKREEPGRHHTALPWQALLALVGAAFTWGWPRVAGALALAWGGLLRIGEVLQATRSDLTLPSDVRYTVDYAYLTIRDPKTRYHAARHQAVRVDQPDILEIIDIAYGKLGKVEKLWNFSGQTLRVRFRQLCRALLLPCEPDGRLPPLELSSLRAGGATWLMMQGEDSELVRRRGRWLSHRIMEIYVQEVSSLQLFGYLPEPSKEKVFTALWAFKDVLAKVRFYSTVGILPTLWYRLIAAGSIADKGEHELRVRSRLPFNRLELIDPLADAAVFGDANLSFALMLAKHREALGHVGRVIATTFETLECLRERYQEIDSTIKTLEDLCSEVYHGVDCTRIAVDSRFHGMEGSLGAVYYNFPHAGAVSGFFDGHPCVNWRHENLMRLFFRALRSFMKPGGLVKVSSSKGAVGVRWFYITESAQENEFIHIETMPFREWHLHRYGRSYGDKRDVHRRPGQGEGYNVQRAEADMVYTFKYAPSGESLPPQSIRMPPKFGVLKSCPDGPFRTLLGEARERHATASLGVMQAPFAAAKKQTFIIKPDNGCQGKGIFLIRDVEKVPVDFSSTYVAQRYISKPLLLDGYKFDLRLYVLVSGCDPLRIFLHRRGLVRLASEQYVEPTKNNLSEVMVHLTNYAINKSNPNFEENTNPDDAQDGHKRSWEAVQEHLRQEGHDVETLLAEIEDLIVKTLIAVQPSLSHFYHSCQPDDVYNGMCFEILGFDVMLDQKLQPWLLEVNHAPSFATESELDRLVKEEVLRDSFNLLDLNPESRRQKKREAREKMEQRAMGMAKKYCIEDRVTQEREFAVLRTEWEDQQLQSCESGYKRLYPSPEKEKEYWQVHDAAINIWEMLMGGTFRRAVRLSDPVEKPSIEDRADSKARAGSAKTGNEKEEPPKPEAKRTAEEIREVVERLAQGCSARPRRNASRRRSGKEEEKGEETASTGAPLAPEEPPEKTAQPEKRNHTNRYVDVQVGDIIKVQTNLGWETVTVRAKRPGTGKIDIQFKDGEYMRAVMPRILRNGEGQPVKEAAMPEGQTSPTLPAANGRIARLGGSSAPTAPVPTSQTGAVPQKLAGYTRGGSSPAGNSRGHPLPAAASDEFTSESAVVAAQDALVGVLLEGCGVTEMKDGGEAVVGYSAPAGDGLPSPSASIVSAGRGGRSVPLGNRAPAVRLKQHLQQLISARPIIAPKVGRSGSIPRSQQTAPEPLLGHGLIGSALAPKESKAARRRSSDT
ncbi:Ttll6a [Symbiodinium microadriaticum]|nr:Ttll6a [Symbiodinium microadriaticum]